MYPLSVEVNEQNIEKIINTFKSAYKEIVAEMATATDWGVANRKAILAQIEKTLQELGQDVDKFVKEEIPNYYKQGADQAVKQLSNIGAEIKVAEGFNRLHNEAIFALVDEVNEATGDALTTLKRSAQAMVGKSVREGVTQRMAKGMLAGEALETVKKSIKLQLIEEGIPALTDAAGREWDLDRYAEMLFRTKVVEARNRGLANRMVENEYDLVQVSSHPGSCELCAPWQGKILSVSGQNKGYETVRDAENEGLFHPNCRHAINAIIPKLARQTNSYDTEGEDYKPSKEKLLKTYAEMVQKSIIPDAMKFQKTWDEKLRKISETTGLEYAPGPVKKMERTGEKVLFDYNGAIYAMKDVNRSVFFIDDPKDRETFDKLIEEAQKSFGIKDLQTDIKRQLNLVDMYASNKISVETPYGARAEIQVTTREMWEAKIKLGGDDLYGLWRDPDTSVEEAQEAYEKMKELYAAASQKTADRLKQ